MSRGRIYFWSGDALLADPRYVFKALSLEAQSNLLVDWLYDGPSNWLDNAVETLPSETRPGVTKVVRGANGRLVIDLTDGRAGVSEAGRTTRPNAGGGAADRPRDQGGGPAKDR